MLVVVVASMRLGLLSVAITFVFRWSARGGYGHLFCWSPGGSQASMQLCMHLVLANTNANMMMSARIVGHCTGDDDIAEAFVAHLASAKTYFSMLCLVVL